MDRYDSLVADAYHLLQAHLTRLQKLGVSSSLRRAAKALSTARHGTPRHAARYRLLHLGVRLGMFTESNAVLKELLDNAQEAVRAPRGRRARGRGSRPHARTAAARTRTRHRPRTRRRTSHRARDPSRRRSLSAEPSRPSFGASAAAGVAWRSQLDGLKDHHRNAMEQPPETAAAHYTIAGFYTYHHRRPDFEDHALDWAKDNLEKALRIQTRQLGKRHVSTLCSQLVKAQVMLLQANTYGCGGLLRKQLECAAAAPPTPRTPPHHARHRSPRRVRLGWCVAGCASESSRRSTLSPPRCSR